MKKCFNRIRRAVPGVLVWVLLACFAALAQADTTFNFTLARACKTSAGVYNSSGKLIRTLWADGQFAAAGTYSAVWDNLDDFGVAAPAGTYTVKVMAHNMNYVWEGVVGNTSDNYAGLTVHSNFNFATTLSFAGTTGCYGVGYSENQPAFYSFSTATPNQVLKSFTGCTGGGNDMSFRYSDADSTRVYFACGSTQDSSTYLWTLPGAVCAFDPATGTVSNFTAGYPIYERYHPFTNGVRVGTQPNITGLAVQKNGGTYLAVSVAADNKVYLLDKASGSAVSSFTVTSPKMLAFDTSDNLWIVTGTSVVKYTNLSSTPTLATTIGGFVAPLALAVSPASASQPNLLLVADGGTSQQVKAYDLAGVSQWTLGQAGGYATSPVVATNKFWFLEPEAFGTADPNAQTTALAFQPDGNFWLLDPMNCRMLRFGLSATAGVAPTYQTQITYRGVAYITAVDRNNPNRLFSCSRGKWLEYSVDYSKTLAPANASWTLAKNWSYGLPSTVKGFGFQGFMGMATLSNGRTYGLVRDTALPSTERTAVYELPASGNIRATGVSTGSFFLEADGSVRTAVVSGNTITFSKKLLTGFDASNNPLWGSSITIATAPAVAGVNPRSGNNNGPSLPITTGNKLVFFDQSKSDGMHLGGIDLNTNTAAWNWETAPAVPGQVPLIGDGSYDNTPSIQYGGGLCDGQGRNIVFTYKGEFWHNSQANQLMHYYENGLFLGQFGTPGDTPIKIAQGAAGNLSMPYMTSSGGKTYVYTNDESVHGGVHRWRLDGTTTIAELTGSGAMNTSIALAGTAPIGSAPAISGAPARPTQLNATPSNGRVFLQWTASPNTTYYQVRRAMASQHGYQIIATGVNENCFGDRNLPNGETCYYTVVPVNEKGAGNASVQTVGTPTATGNVYEAEDGVISGIAIRPDNWASGRYQVANTGTGSITINNMDGGSGGTFPMVIRYSHNNAVNWVGATLKVNGTAVTLPAFPPTGGWQGGLVSPYSEVTVNIPLNAGPTNSILLSKGPCVDKFTILIDTAFLGTPWVVPAGSGSVKIEAENYNYGGEGKGFHDTGPVNVNNVYRAFDAVGIGGVLAASNGFNIGYVSPAEWTDYTVSVPTTKAYTLSLYAGTNQTGRTLRIEDEAGNNLSGTMTIANTGSYTVYAANTASITLSAGTHILRIYNITGGYNLDYFTLSH